MPGHVYYPYPPQPWGVKIADGANLDAFSRLRTSDPETIFDSGFEYGRATIQWHQLTSGGRSSTAHSPLNSGNLLTCGTGNTDYAAIQTKKYIRYQPGKSQLILMTGLFGDAVADVRRRAGIFDAQNGIFFEQNGTTDIAIVRRTYTSGVVANNRAIQADWNLDKLDGSGPSGVTLDLTKTQILVIDLQWLGVGRVRVGFDIGGVIVYAHQFLNANTTLTVPYMQTANLPLRYEIANTAAQVSTHTMLAICSAVLSEGGQQPLGYTFAAGNGITSRSVAATKRAILSIRPKATFGPGAKVVRGDIKLNHLEIAPSSAIYWELQYNPVFNAGAGALTWTSADAESMVEYCTHGDANAGALTTEGSVMDCGHILSSVSQKISFESDISMKRPITLDEAGLNPIAVSIVAVRLGATSSDTYSHFEWTEIR